jgi:hypothetical protein
MSTLFRVGRYLVVGETKKATKQLFQIEVTGWIGREGKYYTLVPCLAKVRPNLVIREDFIPPSQTVQEGENLTFSQILHECLMPLVADLREIKFLTTSLIAYERGTRGLGFLKESKIQWVEPQNALRHKGLGNLLALEAFRSELKRTGIVEKTREGRIDEGTNTLPGKLHVYMKTNPFRDISVIHPGTEMRLRGYHKGCALVEADGEPFWRPVEDTFYVMPRKEDEYYFNLDGDRDGIPDPLTMLPSHPALRGSPGQARDADRYNAQPDMPKVAGNFYAVPFLSNPEYYKVLREDNDPCEAIMAGEDVGEVLSKLLQRP